MKSLIITSIFFVLLMVFTACPTPEKYPIEPEVTFLSIELKDSTDLLENKLKNCKLTFNIIDGDGDIGLKEGDTLGIYNPDSIYYNNIFLTLYEIINNDTITVNDSIKYRTKYLQPIGQDPTLIADIKIDYPFNYDKNGMLKHDYIMFEFYMYDRQQHKSNIAKSLKVKLDTIGFFGKTGLD